jgi:tryptophan-rich hypothetical protein
MSKKQKFPHLVGSTWTSHQTIDGWRHFRVVNRKNQGSWVFAELVAACDPNVRFWLNSKLLKDRRVWQSGWQSLQEAKALLIAEPDAHPDVADSFKVNQQDYGSVSHG